MVPTAFAWVIIIIAVSCARLIASATSTEDEIDLYKILSKDYIKQFHYDGREWMFTKPISELLDITSEYETLIDMKLYIISLQEMIDSPPCFPPFKFLLQNGPRNFPGFKEYETKSVKFYDYMRHSPVEEGLRQLGQFNFEMISKNFTLEIAPLPKNTRRDIDRATPPVYIQRIAPLNVTITNEAELRRELVRATLNIEGDRHFKLNYMERALSVYILSCLGTDSSLQLLLVLHEVLLSAYLLHTIPEALSMIAICQIIIESCPAIPELKFSNLFRMPSECAGPRCGIKLNALEEEFWTMFQNVKAKKVSLEAMIDRFAFEIKHEHEYVDWCNMCATLGLRPHARGHLGMMEVLDRGARAAGLDNPILPCGCERAAGKHTCSIYGKVEPKKEDVFAEVAKEKAERARYQRKG